MAETEIEGHRYQCSCCHEEPAAAPVVGVEEGQHVAEVAVAALGAVVELHRQEEETERVEHIAEAVASVAAAQVPEVTPEPVTETPAVEEVTPAEEVEVGGPPEQEDKTEQKPETEEAAPAARNRFARHRR